MKNKKIGNLIFVIYSEKIQLTFNSNKNLLIIDAVIKFNLFSLILSSYLSLRLELHDKMCTDEIKFLIEIHYLSNEFTV